MTEGKGSRISPLNENPIGCKLCLKRGRGVEEEAGITEDSVDDVIGLFDCGGEVRGEWNGKVFELCC